MHLLCRQISFALHVRRSKRQRCNGSKRVDPFLAQLWRLRHLPPEGRHNGESSNDYVGFEIFKGDANAGGREPCNVTPASGGAGGGAVFFAAFDASGVFEVGCSFIFSVENFGPAAVPTLPSLELLGRLHKFLFLLVCCNGS